jgi:hypothetical protein
MRPSEREKFSLRVPLKQIIEA